MRRILTLLTVLFLPFSAFPWGAVGHETIAYIAEQNLSPETLAKIKPLLGGMSIEEAAVWADQYKQTHRTTAPWHYINLPVKEKVEEIQVQGFKGQKHGNNIINQLEKDIETLKDPATAVADRQKALWFVIHFVGDLHQPLHVADDNDGGGNSKKVRFFSPVSSSNRGHLTNLHSLWDNLIEVKAGEDPRELGAALNKKITSAERQEWTSGSIETWVFESYTLAKLKIYPDVGPDNSSVTALKRNYYARMRPVVDEQLEKAGVRLAKMLEEVFR